MKLYAGIDLHSNNNYLAVLNEKEESCYQKRLPNEIDPILTALHPYQEDMAGIVVESTFNWYWLVDALMAEGYKVHLANPAAIQKYSGLKFSDDKHDAIWLAQMLKLNILPEGYIYPKEERPVRDLLRKRCHLVQLRTSLINSLQGILSRNCGYRITANKIKQVKFDHISPLLQGHEDLELSGKISKESIDHLTMQIRKFEKIVLRRVKLKPSFKGLQTIPGIGKILSFTIMLETGDIARFTKVGKYASYCRKVPTKWTSNNTPKGKGNCKNGNKYLAWAFSEAAEFARRYDERVKSYYNRKLSKTNRLIAHSALAHKLARAAYYIIRDGVSYDQNKLFV